MKRLALPVCALLVGGAADDGARAVLERTRTTTATFASYDWMTGRDEKGVSTDMWVAEFRSGDLYRGESAEYRVVVNCRTHEGYSLDVRSGEVRRDDTLYIGDCGIWIGGSIESVVRLPSVSGGAFGSLDVIRVIDATRIRYYQVDRRGVVIRSNWTSRSGSAYPCIQAEPVARLATLPSADIFTRASLATSAVEAKYRRPPANLPATGLSGQVCGEKI